MMEFSYSPHTILRLGWRGWLLAFWRTDPRSPAATQVRAIRVCGLNMMWRTLATALGGKDR